MLLTIFINNILPPLLVVAAGYLLEKLVGVDPRALSRVALYVLAPAMIFGSLVETEVPGAELGQIALFVFAWTGAMWLLGLLVARLLAFDARRTNTFLLATLFGNTGNLGLAVVLFTFGQAGLERALAFFIASSILTHTLAVYFASRGTSSTRQSLANILKLPLIYAVAIALSVRLLGWTVPEPIMRSVNLARSGAIPVLQILLGVQLARISRRLDLRFVGAATAMQLVGGATVAFGLTAALGLQGLTRSVCILQTGMPTAVNTLTLSIQFGSDPEEVGSVVFLSTLASAISLTILIALLT